MEPFPIADGNPGDTMVIRERLERTRPNAMARMRFALRWESQNGRHTDGLVANALNLWRDLFPSELEDRILDQPVGHSVSHRFAPGELLPGWREDKCLRLPEVCFNRHFGRGGPITPRAGRFYPQGLLEGVAGIFRSNRRPFRLAEVRPDGLVADLNHPLADKTLDLEIQIEDIWAHGPERGGRCNEVVEMVCVDGPGMQVRWRNQATDFWRDLPYLRTDLRPDAVFYARPRFVDHLDTSALAEIRALYGRLLPAGGRLLDLMASWHSHLPETLEVGPVTGLGLNRQELAANPVLSEYLVQDLNQEPRLPFAPATFDAVVCTASVEYLTRPLEIFAEVARVLRPGGRFIVTFSNRWFPPKVIHLWKDLHEFERPGLISEYFLASGEFTHLETWSLRGRPRPEGDKYAAQLPFSDPVYAVWAQRPAA